MALQNGKGFVGYLLWIFVISPLYFHSVSGSFEVAFGFLLDFAIFHPSTFVILHVSPKIPVSSYKSMYESMKNNGKYLRIIHSNNNQCNISLHDTDLHFAFATLQSIQNIAACLNKRLHSNKDPWIILSEETNYSVIYKQLSRTKLDLDDDIYVANCGNNEVLLNEIYKISASGNLESNAVGKWTLDGGLLYANTQKWYRRKNLKVNYTILCLNLKICFIRLLTVLEQYV